MNKMLRLSVFAVRVHCVLLGAAVAETKDDDAYTALRTELVEDVAHSIRQTHAETYVEKLSKRLLQAIRDVPRDAFVTPQLRPYAYFDVPLPVRLDQNISQPSLIALMIELADIKETDVVFETGTGAGYQAAILSKLAK
jgi:protein-L-isoaspartate O-methyltransferase